ncbi:cellulose synthase-like protein G2 isoform X2 [Morus notabilis]|uniref:cellulose synthase-like protein G2 isoform X2 n=1 Tax=Morus notabilis TaxID=981085 RepID=UPI000CED0278|nr:cellulose synthase-like protein G2 isoform X2 [Morus notabilis]
MDKSLPLHSCHVQKLSLIIHRTHTSLHSIAISFLLYYRASFFFQDTIWTTPKLLFPWLFISSSELVISFIWLLGQAYRWRPVTRSVFPERLPGDEKLPSLDVFIVTVDPEKEPTLAVMNTVLSAMAMDYPAEKLHVYLSDDGCSYLTLKGLREAWAFAKWWIPFCTSYKIGNRCPEAYFFGGEDLDSDLICNDEFKIERERLKERYEIFKYRVKEYARIGEKKASNHTRDHPAIIEVMRDSSNDTMHVRIPLLVYVSREKRPSYPHHFKAGALNVLRVSGMLSNSPYILVLDCDMYCNDPTAARRAMCFHLDPKISNSLAFVQFPQRFRNISKNDIYDSQLRSVFSVQWQGVDGQSGPILSGTGFFMKRLSLCGKDIIKEDPTNLRQAFGPSNEFVKTLLQGENYKPNMMTTGGDKTTLLLEEMKLLASCSYEIGTKWGQEVGFLYGSIVEDYLTGFTLHCKGWTSVYCDPPRPQFLGCGTTTLNDYFIQNMRWSSGLVEVGISKYCPLMYGLFHMSIFQSMCYAELAFSPLSFLSSWCFATIPQLCLLNGIHVYPEVSSRFFTIISFLFLSVLSKHLYEVLTTGGSLKTWINEQRIWMMKSIISHLYGCAYVLLKRIGISEARFFTTNKVEDDGQENLYQKGIFDFQTSTTFLAPMAAIIVLNMVSFLVGIARAIFIGDLNKMFAQVFISFYILVINYPIVQGMVTRNDKGRIQSSVTALSTLFCVVFLALIYVISLY